MATADELLARSASGDDKTLIIDNYLRKITIPKSITNLGVEYDDDVLHLDFKLPRYLGTTDLSAFSIRINYLNAKGESDIYTVNKPTIGTDFITFTWLVGPTATRYKGNTKFNVCLRIVNAEGIIDKEYNTTIATLPVLEGLEVDEGVVTEYSDILEQWRRELFGIGDTEEATMRAVSQEEQENITKKGAEVLATIPEEYQETANAAQEGIRTKADAIVCSAQGNPIVVSDSSDDHIRSLRVFGKTTQVLEPSPESPQDLVSVENTTVDVCGGNLFNFKGITGTDNITVNPDGTLTVTIYAATTGKKLNQLAPSLKVGGRYKLTLDTESPNRFIYLLDVTRTWDMGATLTMTDELLNSRVYVYGVNGDVPTIIRNIAIVPEGVTYNGAPYVDPQHIAVGRTLSGISGTADEIDFERGLHIQRIGRISLTGAEACGVLADSVGEMWIQFPAGQPSAVYSNDNVNCICNYYPAVTRTETYNNGRVDGFVGTAISGNYVRITDNVRFNGDYTALNNWIVEKNATGEPITFEYILATPIKTPLTAEELAVFKALRTNYPNTTVINDSGATMELTYNADTKTYVDNGIKQSVTGVLEAIENGSY